MKTKLVVLAVLFSIFSASAESKVWTFRPNFIYDPWNQPILPYLATIPAGMTVSAENIRALIKPVDLASLKASAAASQNGRVVKRQVVNLLEAAADVDKARGYLLPPTQSAAVDVFQVAVGYIDRFGLVGIVQLAAKWQCSADENCPEKISEKLETLLAQGGAIMKTEAYFTAGGKLWILSTITYEIKLGSELRIVPLRSRLMEVQAKT
jgi:hypothetical protein